MSATQSSPSPASSPARPAQALAPSKPTVAVVIVTYDSGNVLEMCLAALARQTLQPDLIVIVDNCSPHPAYLSAIPKTQQFRVLLGASNDGFCRANNTGFRLASTCKYVLFLNPDAFPSERFLEHAVARMESPENAYVGCITGTLLGFDIERRCATDRIDSAGIVQTWFGRWRDRGRGLPWRAASHTEPEDVPAICGALMLCRTAALDAVALRDGEVFDSRFFMYKEDIELSIRLRARGWRLLYVPQLLCHHGRGWRGRQTVSSRARYLSARNELRVCGRNGLRGLPYSVLKYAYVVVLEWPFAALWRHLRK